MGLAPSILNLLVALLEVKAFARLFAETHRASLFALIP